MNDEIELDLTAEFDRMIAEQDGSSDCTYLMHKWVWYQGFHVEQYYFCARCDEKDYTRKPPPRS